MMISRILTWWRDGRWPNQQTTRKAFLLPYLLIVAALIGGLVLLRAQSESDDASQGRTLDAITYVVALNDYTSCVNRSSARDDLIDAINGLYDFIREIAALLDADDIVQRIVAEKARFNEAYEPIDILVDCPAPPVYPGFDLPGLIPTTSTPSSP